MYKVLWTSLKHWGLGYAAMHTYSNFRYFGYMYEEIGAGNRVCVRGRLGVGNR